MLNLSRRTDESVVLLLPNGDKIEINMTKIRGNQVGIGIEAPKHIEIYRGELLKHDD
jgi:carbon storage regulator